MDKLKLYADPKCWNFKEKHPDEFASYGCGPGDGLLGFLTPDTVYGLSIRDACRIHDWGYRHAAEASEDNRAYHDRVFKNNALRIVSYKTKYKILKWLRFRRVITYYTIIRQFGSTAYWEDRNTDVNYRSSEIT